MSGIFEWNEALAETAVTVVSNCVILSARTDSWIRCNRQADDSRQCAVDHAMCLVCFFCEASEEADGSMEKQSADKPKRRCLKPELPLRAKSRSPPPPLHRGQRVFDFDKVGEQCCQDLELN